MSAGRLVAGYARVSTARQAEPGQSLDAQEWAIRDFAGQRNWGVVHIWSDVMSGARDDRPNLALMLAAAERQEFSALVVSRLDRLGRSMRHNLEIYDRLEAVGVHLFALDVPCRYGDRGRPLLARDDDADGRLRAPSDQGADARRDRGIGAQGEGLVEQASVRLRP
jgi:DNA invertase Pin-like site-specific DNA recombinase